MEIIDALKLIVARSPRAGENALRAIAAARNNSPVLQIRYTNVLIQALADGEADFTPEEREQLAAAIEAPESENRGYTLRVRLTESERVELEEAASAAGMSASEYVRRKVFGE